MKYIRTKDGRILYMIEKCEYKENKITYIVGWDLEDNFEINQEDVINQADTIEELCDEFVAFKTKEDYGILSATDYIEGHKWEMEDYAKNGYQIYACIWVIDSNGAPTLKPVAKMNDKGELELL